MFGIWQKNINKKITINRLTEVIADDDGCCSLYTFAERAQLLPLSTSHTHNSSGGSFRLRVAQSIPDIALQNGRQSDCKTSWDVVILQCYQSYVSIASETGEILPSVHGDWAR